MPVKLQVVKEGADAGDPADYLFEQDRITIGRGSSNDLTLPDQKVSTEHAEIRHEEGSYLLSDRQSKNDTYVDGRRVGEEEPYVLESGDVFRVGDFKIEFAPLFMPASEQTAFAEEDENDNPFEKDARRLAAALEGLAETYRFAPAEARDDHFTAAVEKHLAHDTEVEASVRRVLGALELDAALDDGDADARPPDATGDAVAAVLDALLESVTRMISIPDHFWREFTGEAIDHSSEKEALHEASVDELREHLLGDGLSGADRRERLDHLDEAVDSLVAHNMAMLAGYKEAVMAGSEKLLRRLDPADAIEEKEENAGRSLGSRLFGRKEESELDRLHEEWTLLFERERDELENELFRPTYIDAYVDRMAQTWDVDEAQLLEAGST